MRKSLIYLSLFIIAAGFSNCKKKKPVACATADKKTILMGESVNFTSCTTDAVKLIWDFGDGQTGEGESVSHKYDSAGVYVVVLKGESKKAKFIDKFALAVTVNRPPLPPPPPPPAPIKYRYLTKITLTRFAAQNNGSNWDTPFNTDPDIIVRMELEPNSGWSWESVELSNVTNASMPQDFNLDPANIKLSNQSWKISILDNDLAGARETMFSTIINPATITATNGKFSIGNADYNLDMNFIER